MKILLYKDLIYKIVFKKIKISINDESSAFLSNSSDLKISFLTNLKLLSKFNMCYWDEPGNTNCLKFLVKYSPIFSKFIEPEELEQVDFGQIEKIEPTDYYVEIYGKKFFIINGIEYDCLEETFTIFKDKEFFKEYQHLFEKRD